MIFKNVASEIGAKNISELYFRFRYEGLLKKKYPGMLDYEIIGAQPTDIISNRHTIKSRVWIGNKVITDSTPSWKVTRQEAVSDAKPKAETEPAGQKTEEKQNTKQEKKDPAKEWVAANIGDIELKYQKYISAGFPSFVIECPSDIADDISKEMNENTGYATSVQRRDDKVFLLIESKPE